MNKRTTTDFFKDEYCNWASYDNLRKIASLVDGQKNAARKVLWYTLQKNLKNEVKVSQLNSKVAEETEYLHGDMSGVIVNLAQSYTGTNNLNLLVPEGNFGTRLIPEASAPRYIYTHGSNNFFDMFTKEDTAILEHQMFEGHEIEPVFMLPKLPLLLINGSEGISSGFAQKILPRNPEEIAKYIKYYLKKPDAPKKPFQNKPWYKGFKGDIKQGDTKNQWVIEGKFQRKGTKVIISELPIGYSLKSYLKVLNKLEDDKKIQTYTENCMEDFYFEVTFLRKDLNALSDDKLMELLKLRKKVTENYTVMNHLNQVKVFDNISEVLWAYIDIKLEYTNRRKAHLIQSLSTDIRELISKYTFISGIVDETLVITKRPTDDIIADLDKTPRIIKVDDTYDYLLNMNIRSLTEEKKQALLNTIKAKKEHLDDIKAKTAEQLWLKDLK